MKARNFYYENFALKHKGQSYQKIHQKDHYLKLNSKEAKKILNHIPNQSNDRMIEGLVNEIANRNSEEIRLRIKNMFIAKINSLEANAYAMESNNKYWSDLIFFHVGLSDICFQFCINNLEFITFKDRDGTLLNANSSFKGKFLKNSYDLSNKCAEWIKNDAYIQLDVKTAIIPFNKEIELKASSLATFTDMFILAHEISHHLLNHTGRNHDFNDYLGIISKESYVYRKNTNKKHQNEFEADAFAILLLLGVTPNNYKQKLKEEKQLSFEMSFGVLFTLEIISRISKEDFESSTHPLIQERIENIQIVLNQFVSDKILRTINHSFREYFTFLDTFKR